MSASIDNQTQISIGQKLFQYRDYTPVPLVILLLIMATPTVALATLGILLILVGELIRIYSVAFIGSISRTRKDRTGGRLIKEGPFGYMRNPLYVGNFFIAFGVSVFGGNIYIMALTVLLFSAQYYFIVKYEESLLRETFGKEYEIYCEEVPAWIPKKSLKIDDIEWPEDFTPALRSEKRTVSAIAVIIILLLLGS